MQFVEFRDYKGGDLHTLSEEVLKEVPDQVVGYMMMKGIKPQKNDWRPVDEAITIYI